MSRTLAGRTVVFDLDGTLVDTAPDLMGGIDLLLQENGLDTAPHALLRPLVSNGARVMIKRALAHIEHQVDEPTFEVWWQRYLTLYADNIAVRSRPFEGLEVVLDRLATRGATLAVCTNKNEALSLKLLDALGMRHRFQGIAGRDTFPNCFKPDPEHLRGAVRLAGGDPARAVMVGDSDVDISAARNAGVPVIAVTFGYCEHPVATFAPDAAIDHYDAFEAALDRLIA